MSQYPWNKIVSCLRKESFQGTIESSLIDTVCDDKGFCSSSAFQCRIDCAFVVANQHILFYQFLFSNIPIKVSRHHVIFYILWFVLVLFCIDKTFLGWLCTETSKKICCLKSRHRNIISLRCLILSLLRSFTIILWYWLSFFTCILLDLFYDFVFTQIQEIIDVRVTLLCSLSCN